MHIYQPKATGSLEPKIYVSDLIPRGYDNAIPRAELLKLCIQHGLVEDNSGADREMRKLINAERKEYVIINNSDGRGYYIPTKDDLIELRRHIKQEESRIAETAKNLKKARALYEDYVHGRYEDE